MSEKKPPAEKRRTYVPLILILPALLLVGVFVLKKPRESGLTLASENKKDGDKKSAPSEKQKQEDPNEKTIPRPDHNHPAFGERVIERTRLVARYIEGEGIHDPNVLRSLCTVPRHAFVRPSDFRRAYADHPLPIGLNQTISQPYIVAYMTEVLKLGRDSKVFEVGTGSGYQAAVCAEIAKEVYTVEILEKLAKSAKKRLKDLGYRNVTVKAADGYFGWEEKGPFDAIIVTAAAMSVPPPLVKQLKAGGRMILPKGSPYGAQWLVLITKDNKGKVRSQRLLPVRFVPMTGRVTEAKEPRQK